MCILASGVVAAAWGVAAGEVVVLASGARVLSTGPARYEGERVLVPLVGGGTGLLKRADVDEEATREANATALRLSWKYRELPWWPQPPLPAVPAPPPPLGLIAPGGASRSCYSGDDIAAPPARRGRRGHEARPLGATPPEAPPVPSTPGSERVGREESPPSTASARDGATGSAVIGAEGPLLRLPGFQRAEAPSR